jgi:hypothetical protein
MPRMKGKGWKVVERWERKGEGRMRKIYILSDEREWMERRKDGVEKREEIVNKEGMKWRGMEGKGRRGRR